MTGSSGIACVQFCLVSGTEFLKEVRPLSFPSMPSQAWGWTRDPTGGLFEKPKKKAQKGPMGLLVTSDPHSSLNVKCPLSEHETPHYLQPASVAAPKPCPHPGHYRPKGFYVSYLGPFPSSVTLKWIQKENSICSQGILLCPPHTLTIIHTTQTQKHHQRAHHGAWQTVGAH